MNESSTLMLTSKFMLGMIMLGLLYDRANSQKKCLLLRLRA